MSHEDPWEVLERAAGDPLREWYVNTIWGRRQQNDNALFEVMALQVFQAGLTWKMVLSRRDSFRAAFNNWDIDTVAAMGPEDVERLRQDQSIIRNRQKIEAAIANARTVQALRRQHDSFCRWFYDVLEGEEYPVLQETLRSTFKFMGPEISRMWLMASGRITREEGDKYAPSGG